MDVAALRACLVGLVMALCLNACVPLRPYHTTRADAGMASMASTGGATPLATPCYGAARHGTQAEAQPEAQPQAQQEAPHTCLRFVEYDDFGNAFNRAQLDETVAAARAVAQRGGIVVLYVHGWEHDAHDGDADLAAFHRAIENAQALDRQYHDERDVFGIYVGWRGKSLAVPGVSKVTFWERKTTAQAIGDGAVFELMRKLANAREEAPRSRLVLIGHSFGAALTYASVFHSVSAQIIDDPAPSGPASPNMQDMLDTGKRWDMVVLINPAFEAMQLRPLVELARSRTYLPSQLPHLVLITTDADWATGMAFPAGRWFRSVFNKYADAASPDLYRSAVGHYLPYITHQLAVVADCVAYRPRSGVADQLGKVAGARSMCFDDVRARLPQRADAPQALPVLLTRCVAAGDCAQVGVTHPLPTPEHMPILNIRTTRDVMAGHNDIWNPTMHAFLVQMMLSTVARAPLLAPGS